MLSLKLAPSPIALQVTWKSLERAQQILKTNYGSETVIPLYITGCREKIYSESAVVTKRS